MANISDELKQLLVSASKVTKNYIDKQDAITKEELQKKILDDISKVKDLNATLEDMKLLSASFVEVFDENKDGKISVDEVIAKITGVNAKIDALKNELSNELVNIKDMISFNADAILKEISNLYLQN